MPIYPPRNEPTRKIEVLEKRIMELEKCFRANASQEKTINKAELVRTAQLNLIKARLALMKPYRFEDRTESKQRNANKLQKEHTEWEKTLNEIIIEKYKPKKTDNMR